MAYFSNKPAPSLGHLLPRPGFNAAVIKEPELRPNLKRKLKDSESGICIIFLFAIHIDILNGIHTKCYKSFYNFHIIMMFVSVTLPCHSLVGKKELTLH